MVKTEQFNLGIFETLIFDRDGVINELVLGDERRGPRSIQEFKFRHDFLDFITRIDGPRKFAIATNQPDIARGKLSPRENELITARVLAEFPSGVSYFECPHDNQANCLCRKPKNGMLETAIQQLDANRATTVFIGDSWTDIVAGKKSNISTVLLRTPNSFLPTSQGSPSESIYADLEVTALTQLLNLAN